MSHPVRPDTADGRSSVTALEEASQSPTQQVLLSQEITRHETSIEKYGGDEVREPPPKLFRPGTRVPEPLPLEEKPDPNMVTWDGPHDPQNPMNFTTRYKWLITVICIMMTLNVTFASSSPSSTTLVIQHAFHVNKETSYLITSTFLMGYMIGPLFWGPGSELIGRRPIFVLTMSCYTLFHIGQALAQNIEALLATRFLAGFFAVAPLTNCGGVIVDVWPAVGRGPAVSLFTAAVFMGPVLGPIVSGYIIQSHTSWRWVYWVMMIFAGTCTLIMIVLLPETYAPVILLKKVKKLRKKDPEGSKDLYAEHEKQDWSMRGVFNRTLLRPFKMLALEPILSLVTLYLSLVYGILYALFQMFPIIFITKRHFRIGEDGLMFISVGIGTTIGSIINYITTAHYPELIAKWRGFPPPEQRLFGAMIGSPGLVVGAFWLGWTGHYPAVPWYVPGLAGIVLGMSISLIFMSFLSYLVDTYLMYSASALSANTVIRSGVAASFPLFTVQMFTNMGVNWAATLWAFIALALAPSPFLFYKYGPLIRSKSKFAPCIDLKIALALEEEERNRQP